MGFKLGHLIAKVEGEAANLLVDSMLSELEEL